MHHIYCISGLGADRRIFQRLKINNAQLHFIEWELPGQQDTMRSYALKLAGQIKHPLIILVGVSFGGMLASEISRYYQQLKSGDIIQAEPGPDPTLVIQKTILISSCKYPAELPSVMRMVARLKAHKAVPYHFVLRNQILNRFVFDLRSKNEELQLKRKMLQENEITMIKRAIHIILTWKANLPGSIVHIHGSADRLLTPTNVQADYWVKEGSHFMVWNKADEISAILNNLLQE